MNYILYFDKIVDKDMFPTLINSDRGGNKPFVFSAACKENALEQLYSPDEINSNYEYKCFTKATFLPDFKSRERSETILTYKHKCLEVDSGCTVPPGLFNVGFRLNYTVSQLSKYEDFLSSVDFVYDLKKTLTIFLIFSYFYSTT
jgi:hypothetical protein